MLLLARLVRVKLGGFELWAAISAVCGSLRSKSIPFLESGEWDDSNDTLAALIWGGLYFFIVWLEGWNKPDWAQHFQLCFQARNQENKKCLRILGHVVLQFNTNSSSLFHRVPMEHPWDLKCSILFRKKICIWKILSHEMWIRFSLCCRWLGSWENGVEHFLENFKKAAFWPNNWANMLAFLTTFGGLVTWLGSHFEGPAISG